MARGSPAMSTRRRGWLAWLATASDTPPSLTPRCKQPHKLHLAVKTLSISEFFPPDKQDVSSA
eukprot:scaffold652296_cov42-Prasinocladus_malaysianus.AAC.1